MIVYFVRHGEAVDQQRFHQSPDIRLSETGQHQINQLAQRLAGESVEAIISSDYPRALESAQILKEALGKEIQATNLLREVCRPSEFVGKDLQDEAIKRIKQELQMHYSDPDWHYSDEENYHDCIERAKAASLFLQQQAFQTMVVVTHENFLKILLLTHLLLDAMSPEAYIQFYNHSSMYNAGLTKVEIQSANWKLLTWNEHAYVH